MKKKKIKQILKKVLTVSLALTMLFTFLPLNVIALEIINNQNNRAETETKSTQPRSSYISPGLIRFKCAVNK